MKTGGSARSTSWVAKVAPAYAKIFPKEWPSACNELMQMWCVSFTFGENLVCNCMVNGCTIDTSVCYYSQRNVAVPIVVRKEEVEVFC